MNDSIQAHDSLTQAVATRYRRDGYEVALEPEPEAIPFDLGGYRPDLIARKGDRSVIVEVKTRADRTSFEQLRPLVHETKQHQGWRFVLVTEQDVLGLDPQTFDDDKPSWQELASEIDHAKRLIAAGESEAAYLALWITFERMMRLQASLIGLPLDRLAPSILIRQLYSQGELTMDQFDTALKCQEIRDRIVHGFRVSGIDDASGRLRVLASDVLAHWSTPNIEN